jgi:hypothetical protein
MLQIKRKRLQRAGGRRYREMNPVVRKLRNVVVSVAVLVALIIVAGLAWTWFSGQNSAPVKVAAVPKVPSKSHAPQKPSPTGVVGVAVQFISTPVRPGDNATMTIHTNIGANCTIMVAYNNVPAKDSGLVPKKADDMGLVTWGWTVPTTTPVGKWPATATCANTTKSGMVVGTLEVVKTLPTPAATQ